MTNRTDWPELVEEIVELMPDGACNWARLRERIAKELHNAFVAGQESMSTVYVVWRTGVENHTMDSVWSTREQAGGRMHDIIARKATARESAEDVNGRWLSVEAISVDGVTP